MNVMEFGGKFSNIDMNTILRRGKNINKPKKSRGTMLDAGAFSIIFQV